MYEIVSHPLCPFAHRLVLVARLAGLIGSGQCTVIYIPYPDLPKWLPELSPSGALPLLRKDGDIVTTDPVEASDALMRAGGTSFLGGSPKEQSGARAGEVLAGAALGALRQVFTAKDADSLRSGLAALFTTVAEAEQSPPPADLDRIDSIAWAPAFSLIRDFPALAALVFSDDVPTMRTTSRLLCARPEVLNTRCPDIPGEFTAFFTMTGSRFTNLIQERTAA